MTKLASSSMCSTAACHDDALLLLLQIMQNFRISPPRKGVFPRYCVVHTAVWRRTIPRIFLVLLYNSRLAQFADFTKRRTGINFSICFNSHPMCSARQTLEIIFHWFFNFFFLLLQLHTTLFLGLCRSGTEPWNLNKFPPQNTCLFFCCVSPQNRPRNRFSAVLVTTRNSR